jgi:hypothetical protein
MEAIENVKRKIEDMQERVEMKLEEQERTQKELLQETKIIEEKLENGLQEQKSRT